MLPRVLKNFAVFVDGRGYAGRCDEVELPKFSIKTEEYRGGGMDVPVELDQGMEKMEAKITFAETDANLVSLFGFTERYFTLRGAMQRQGENAVPVVLRLFGMCKQIDPGNWKAGDRGNLALSIALTKIEYEVDGDPVVIIDTQNMIRMIGGVDQLASQRAALGM